MVGLAGVSARRSEPERAARLFGAAQTLGDAASVTVAFPPTRALYEQDLANVRAQLDAEAFEMFWAEGQAMTVTEAVAQALVEDI